MKKPRNKNYTPLPLYKGKMVCGQGHEWSVVDLNQELVTVKCPVCGMNTDINKAKQI